MNIVSKYLNGTFLNLFDANIKSAIKQVKIPYRKGSGFSTSVTSGSSGLSAKIFLLSGTEVNMVQSYVPTMGAKLDYFKGCSTTAADTKRVANSEATGSATEWWLRCPYCQSGSETERAHFVSSNGNRSNSNCVNLKGIRPVLILPSTLLVDSSGLVITNTAPTTPASVTIPSTIMGGSTITVSWGASTDAEKNLAGYKVERSVNGGGSWTQIYQGTATQTTDKVPFGTETVMYRVRAYDSDGLHSGYMDKVQIAESLSQVAVTEIIGVVLAYAVKSAVENLSKNNRWPDKGAAPEDTEQEEKP